MGKGACSFKERDVRAAINAARKAGIVVTRIEVGKDGRIVIVAGTPGESNSATTNGNEWDEILDGENSVALR
jgi:hypothetical protein